MAVNLEQWDPNIKSPGVDLSPSGAYRNPEAVIPDWKSITAGWRQMGQDLASGVKEMGDAQVTIAKAAKIEAEKKAKEKEEDEKQRNLDNRESSFRLDHEAIEQLEPTTSKMVEDFYENTFKREDLIARYGEDFSYADMNQKDQIILEKDSKQVGTAGRALGKIAIEYRKNNNINYTTLVKEPEVAEFLNKIMGTPNALRRIEKRNGVNGVVWKNKAGDEQFMPLNVIVANVGIYDDASATKDEIHGDLKDIVTPIKKEIDKIIDGVGDWGDRTIKQKQDAILALTKELETQIIGKEGITQGIFAGGADGNDVRQFIFNNLLGEEYDSGETTPMSITPPFGANIPVDIHLPKMINRRFTELDSNDPKMVKKFNEDLMEYVNTSFNVVKDPMLFGPVEPILTPSQIETQQNLQTFGLESDDITPSVTDAFARVRAIAGVPFKEEGIAPGDILTTEVLPTSGPKYNKLYKAWNKGATFQGELKQTELKQIVQYGLQNDGDFKGYTGSNKTHATGVYEVWEQEFGKVSRLDIEKTDDAGKVTGAIKQEALDKLLNFSGDKINGQVIVTDDDEKKPKIIKRNGKTIVKMWYPKGSVGADGIQLLASEAVTFDVSDETGQQNFFRAIMGTTEANTEKTNNAFLYLLNRLKK